MNKRKEFVERTARKPYGDDGIKMYNEPKAHYKSFRLILDELKLSSVDRYLEIGCGGGILLKQALEKASSAAALDHSEDMVKLAINNNREAVENNIVEIVSGDAGCLPWQDESFTAAANANMFFFLDEPDKALREIWRVLRPGGRLAMVTTPDSLIAKMSFGWFYSMKLYSDKMMAGMLVSAGFKDVSVRSNHGFMQICTAKK